MLLLWFFSELLLEQQSSILNESKFGDRDVDYNYCKVLLIVFDNVFVHFFSCIFYVYYIFVYLNEVSVIDVFFCADDYYGDLLFYYDYYCKSIVEGTGTWSSEVGSYNDDR